jgi:transposase-like protein
MTKNDQIRQLHSQGLSIKEIARKLGVSYQRVYQVVQKIQDTPTEPEPEPESDQETNSETETCSICGNETESWIAKNDLLICPHCLKELTKVLSSADWDNLKEGDCPYCDCGYIGVEYNGKFVCADCLAEMIHDWFKPASE